MILISPNVETRAVIQGRKWWRDVSEAAGDKGTVVQGREGTEQCGRRAGLVLRLPHGKRAAKAVLTWAALSCALCLSLPCSEVSVTM